jgi:FMN phosphatase YigB (HAD superfamily)
MVVTSAVAVGEPPALYTFDVFDTLITRIWLRPADVFLHAALLMQRAGSAHVSADEWPARRQAAERRLRMRLAPREVTIEQIYGELAAELGWNAAESRTALLLELECERRAVRPIRPMISRLARFLQGRCKLALVSDFYVSADFVTELLNRAGVAVERADLFVSCDEQVTKKSGELFDVVIKRYQLKAEQICHIGDHPVSDDQQARKAGLTVLPYVRSPPLATELLLAKWGNGAAERLIASAIGGAARRARIDRELEGRAGELWNIATAVAGPLLFGYVYWLLMRARETGVERLYFLARDGQILLRIAQHVDRSLGLGLDLRYLHASRRAWFLPSVALGSAQDRAAAVLADPEVSLRDLLASLAIDSAEVSACLQAAGFPHSSWHEKVASERLKGVLCEPPFARLIAERADRERVLCLEYLTDHGMFDSVPKAIVDVGWKGRLQTALARLSRSVNGSLPTGFYLALRERPSAAMIGTTEVYLEGPEAMVLNPALTELFSAADHGSTLGYEKPADAPVTPVLATGNQPALNWGIQEFQEGIASFALNMLEAIQTLDEAPAHLVAALRQCSLASVRRLVNNPTLSEASLLGSFPHTHDQFHGARSELAPQLPLSLIVKGILRPATLDKASHWHQASIVRSVPRTALALKLWHARVTGVPRVKRWFRWPGAGRGRAPGI